MKHSSNEECRVNVPANLRCDSAVYRAVQGVNCIYCTLFLPTEIIQVAIYFLSHTPANSTGSGNHSLASHTVCENPNKLIVKMLSRSFTAVTISALKFNHFFFNLSIFVSEQPLFAASDNKVIGSK